MDKWQKVTSVAKSDGAKIIRYEWNGNTIVSWKRPIPHSGRSGSWMYTSYILTTADGFEREYHSLKDAKAAAEVASNG